jgi:uncharacterized protein (DUF488 family)
MNEIYSLGHSNLSLKEFMALLKNIGIEYLIDVRSDPNSSYVPHFNRNNLEIFFNEAHIQYLYSGEKLGGRQKTNYEKYIYTLEYQEAIKNIEKFIVQGKTAIMCSERDYNNCHRKFICETLLNLGYNVIQVKSGKDKPIMQTNILGFTDNE